MNKKINKIGANEILQQVTNGRYGVSEDNKVEQVATGLKGEIITPNIASDVLPILPKWLTEYRFVNTRNFNYQILNLYPLNFITNGQKRFDYEIKTNETIQQSSNTQFIPDNTTYPLPESKAVSETFNLTPTDEEMNKFSILDRVVGDFARNATENLNIINLEIKQNEKVFQKRLTKNLWTAVNDNIRETITLTDDIVDNQKTLYETIISYNTARDDLTDTVNGNTYTFDTKIPPTEFYAFLNKEFASEWAIDFIRNSFQFKEANLPEMQLKGIYITDFSKEYGLKDQADLVSSDVIFLPVAGFENLGQFELSKRLETDKDYSNYTHYLKSAVYKVKGVKPVIVFSRGTAVATATISNLEGTDPTTIGGLDGAVVFDATIADFTATATATLTPATGTTALSLTDGANTGLTFEDLPAGTYTVNILDGASVITSQDFTLTDPAA